MYPIAEPDASEARIKGLLKLGYPNTGAVIKACFNVLKEFSQSLVHLKLIYLLSISGLMELQFLHNLLHISYNSRLIPEMI